MKVVLYRACIIILYFIYLVTFIVNKNYASKFVFVASETGENYIKRTVDGVLSIKNDQSETGAPVPNSCMWPN